MLLEFTSSGKAALTIFKNGECMGQMYPDIAPGEYYPCVSLVGGKNSVQLNVRCSKPRQPYTYYEGCNPGNASEHQESMQEEME